METFRIQSRQPSDPDARTLIVELDAELHAQYSAENCHGLTSDEMEDFSGTFFVGYLEEEPVACGALRPLEENVAELKRMFVRTPARGKGLGRKLLEALESHARESGIRTIRLETGIEQKAAISLYESSGYRHIPLFGEYIGSAISVCFEKDL